MKNNKTLKKQPTFVIYETDNNIAKVSVRLEEETVWLTQKQLAEIFDSTKQNIGQHIKNIIEDGELDRNSVVKFFFTTAADLGMFGLNDRQIKADLHLKEKGKITNSVVSRMKRRYLHCLTLIILQGCHFINRRFQPADQHATQSLKSRRDGTLRHYKCVVPAGLSLGGCQSVRRLKPAVNRVSSLRDFAYS